MLQSAPRTLAGQTAQQVPMTPAGIRPDYAEIQAALHPFVPHACRYHDYVTRFHRELPAFFAAELQCRRASINRQHFVRCAVVVMKG